MALTTTTNKVIHNGNASATVFAYTFPILDASHLTVIYTDADDVETTLSASQFSVTGIGGRSGGSVTYPLTGSPIATGTKLTIVRTVPYTQTTVLANQGGYYPEVVETRLDLITMQVQQLAEIVGRYTVSSISDPATEQSNYALIQALQSDLGDFDKLTTAGDILTHNGSAYIRLARGDSDQYLGVSGSALTWKDLVIDLASSQVAGVLPRANGGFMPSQNAVSLAANVAIGATGIWVTGPSFAQGSSGVWLAWGTVTINAGASSARVSARLTDGTNVKASTTTTWPSAVTPAVVSLSLSGFFANPPGDIRIQGLNADSTGGGFIYNQSGQGKDCTLNVIRIA
jgi:hypothetical protein